MLRYSPFRVLLLASIIIGATVLDSCSVPTLQITAPYTLRERVSLGFRKALMYELSDSLSAFAKQRYVPFYRIDLLNEKGEVVQRYIGAVQEYISRVAGSLSANQKSMIQASIGKTTALDSATMMTYWNYPRYDGEVSDISASGEAIRTRYWSIDSVALDSRGNPMSSASNESMELYTTRAISIPYKGTTMQLNRTAADFRALRSEADEFVYYDFKSFVLKRFANQ